MRAGFSVRLAAACLLAAANAFGQAAPTKITGLHVTKVSGVAQDNCFDEQNLYLNVTMPDGQVLTADPHVEGIDGHGWGCSPWVTPYKVDVSSQSVTFQTNVLACENDAVFHVELLDRDGDIFNGGDDVIQTCDVNVLGVSGEVCCDQGANSAICIVPIVDPLVGIDSDRDGLSDIEETSGRDINCDGVMTPGVDLFLPQMGASSNHKDLFIEMNWFTGYVPDLAGINAVKFAFANAPIDAAGVSNPDGQPGINLHVDAGVLINDVGPAHTEGGIDFGDPSGAPTNSDDLQAFMEASESAQRRGVFRQFLFSPAFRRTSLPGAARLGTTASNWSAVTEPE
jgi:hypothetical protein